jgi:hypothetical protein
VREREREKGRKIYKVGKNTYILHRKEQIKGAKKGKTMTKIGKKRKNGRKKERKN